MVGIRRLLLVHLDRWLRENTGMRRVGRSIMTIIIGRRVIVISMVLVIRRGMVGWLTMSERLVRRFGGVRLVVRLLNISRVGVAGYNRWLVGRLNRRCMVSMLGYIGWRVYVTLTLAWLHCADTIHEGWVATTS